MDLTLGLAIWGAATGTAATAGGTFALLRDRPRISARQTFEVKPTGNAWEEAIIVLLVVNEGRQPLALVDAGFAMTFVEHGHWPRQRRLAGSAYGNTKGPEFPVRVEPGASIEVRIGVSAVRVEPGYLPQGFAEDSRGKVVMAKPAMTMEVLRQLPGVRPEQLSQGAGWGQ